MVRLFLFVLSITWLDIQCSAASKSSSSSTSRSQFKSIQSQMDDYRACLQRYLKLSGWDLYDFDYFPRRNNTINFRLNFAVQYGDTETVKKILGEPIADVETLTEALYYSDNPDTMIVKEDLSISKNQKLKEIKKLLQEKISQFCVD